MKSLGGLIQRMKLSMRKIMVLFVLLVCVASAALADTLYLKNGREVVGLCIGFENGEFTIVATNGNQLKFKADRVQRLVIDRDTTRRGRDGSTISGSSRSGRWESFDPFDVRPENSWVQSPIRVYNGQRVRVEASGTVNLDGRTNVTAEGLSGQRNRNAPMPNQNDGALIARIGQGFNVPPIYIGNSSEFVADRDGVLYFAVNHPPTANSRGVFLVNVSTDRGAGNSGDDRNSRWPGTSQGREKIVAVSANQAWTDTGIDVEPYMKIEIIAEGQIEFDRGANVGPDGNRSLDRDSYPVRNIGVGAVIAKIRYRDGRESNPIFIGSRNQMNTQQNENGRLFIGVNDDNFRDNSGSYRLTIRW
jgi:hypothetical protein